MPDPSSKLAAFLAELKRRRVFRVAIVYAGVTFIIIQLVDGIFDIMGTPPWVGQVVVVLLALGFPIAVALAWAFDITDKGIVRTKGKAQAPATSRRPILTNWTLGIVAALAIIVAAWSWWGRPGPEALLGEKSIAVLPFINMSADPEQEYFCDGMSEEIINKLSQIEDLRVIARTSSFFFKGKDVDIPDIGKKLAVEWVLEGSVRKAGNRVRVTAQLVKVTDQTHIFSNNYDRDLEDIFAIQDEISLAIVEALKVKLLKTEKAAIVRRYTEDLEAYNLYLKGNHYWQMLTTEGFEKAVECYEQALQKDANYALAYTGLASLYWASSYWGNVPPNEAYPRAEEYAKKALEIDNYLAEAHASLGFINMNYDWNWKAAEQEFRQALQLNPNHSLTHYWFSSLLTFTERHEEAISEIKRAQELDPLSDFLRAHVGLAFSFAGQNDRAIEELHMTLTMNPNYYLARYFLGWAYLAKSMFEEAIAEFEKAVDLSGGASIVMTWLATAYYKFGKKDKAEELFDSLKQRSIDRYVPPMCFYLIHRARGDQDQAFEWVKRACEEHDSLLPWVRVNPLESERIPDEPRFKALLEQYGLE